MLIAACGGSSETPAGQTSSATPKASIQTREDAERQAGFTILLPSHLPANVNPSPQYHALPSRHGADVRYFPQGDNKEAESPAVLLHEQSGGQLAPNGAFVTETISGTAVQISEYDRGDAAGTPATITGVWNQADLKMSVVIVWGSESDLVDLTDEMRAVARRLIESVISPQPSP